MAWAGFEIASGRGNLIPSVAGTLRQRKTDIPVCPVLSTVIRDEAGQTEMSVLRAA
jgi:hypothetical protein